MNRTQQQARTRRAFHAHTAQVNRREAAWLAFLASIPTTDGRTVTPSSGCVFTDLSIPATPHGPCPICGPFDRLTPAHLLTALEAEPHAWGGAPE